jgi:hypothetical protein
MTLAFYAASECISEYFDRYFCCLMFFKEHNGDRLYLAIEDIDHIKAKASSDQRHLRAVP